MGLWDALDKKIKNGKKKGGGTSVNIYMLEPPMRQVDSQRSFFTGYGDDGMLQPDRPTHLMGTNNGLKTVHEGERVNTGPNGELQVIPANEVGGQEKLRGIPGYQSGLNTRPSPRTTYSTLDPTPEPTPAPVTRTDQGTVVLPSTPLTPTFNTPTSTRTDKGTVVLPNTLFTPTFNTPTSTYTENPYGNDRPNPGGSEAIFMGDPYGNDRPNPGESEVNTTSDSNVDYAEGTQQAFNKSVDYMDPDYWRNQNRPNIAAYDANLANELSKYSVQVNARTDLTPEAKKAMIDSYAMQLRAGRSDYTADLALGAQTNQMTATGDVFNRGTTGQNTELAIQKYEDAKSQYEDKQFWSQFDALMQTDPEQAAKLFTEKTGTPMDVSDILALREQESQGAKIKAMDTTRSNTRSIISEFSQSDPSDPANKAQAYAQTKNAIRDEIAFNTGRDPDTISENEIESYFNTLWANSATSEADLLYQELENTEAYQQYFDTEAERRVISKWVADMEYGDGYTTDEDGNIVVKDGYQLPWNDPKYSLLFNDLDGNPLELEEGPKTYKVKNPDGSVIEVSHEQVIADWNNFIEEVDADLEFTGTYDDLYDDWKERYLNGTLGDWDWKGDSQQADFQDSVDLINDTEDGHNLVIGDGLTGIVAEDVKSVVDSLEGAKKEDVPDIIGSDLFIGSASTNNLSSLWEHAGFNNKSNNEDGDRRTVLTSQGVDWVNENAGKVFEWDNNYYVIVGYTPDSGERWQAQAIRVYDVANQTYKYISRPKTAVAQSGIAGDVGAPAITEGSLQIFDSYTTEHK